MVNVREPDAGDSLSAAEADLYRRINAYRVSLGLGQLRLSKALTTTANRHLLDLSSRGAFEHAWAAGSGLDQWNAAQQLTGYSGTNGEILTTAQDPGRALSNWQNSPAHDTQLRQSAYRSVGIAITPRGASVYLGTADDPTGAPAIDGFDGLRYVASNPDLAAWLGPNAEAGRQHYLSYGIAEGRSTTAFGPFQYLASNADLRAAFGADAAAAERHWIQYGRAEGRTQSAFDAAGYLASNADLLAAFGGDRDAAAQHWLTNGRAEGRRTDAFNAAGYLAANPDLLAAFGTDLTAAVQHYVAYGHAEGRLTAAPRAAMASMTAADQDRHGLAAVWSDGA